MPDTTTTTTTAGTTTTVTGSTTTVTGSTTTVTGSTTTVTGSTTTIAATAATGMSVDVRHVFTLYLSQAADLASVASRSSFVSNCRSSVASALGHNVNDVAVESLTVTAARRLQSANTSLASTVNFQYRVTVGSLSAINATITDIHSASVLQVFHQRLISAEQAVSQGLQIARIIFLHADTEAAFPYTSLQQDPNFTSTGGVLNVYANPGWALPQFQSWGTSASPAVQAALLRILRTQSPSMSGTELVVHLGHVELTSSYVQIQYAIYVQVTRNLTLSDPNGTLYQDRVAAYSMAIASMNNASEFASFFSVELNARGLPELPGMSFAPASFASSGGYSGSAASGELVAIILLSIIAAFAICYCIVRRKRIARRVGRLGHRICPKFVSRPASPIAPADVPKGLLRKPTQDIKIVIDGVDKDDPDRVLHFQDHEAFCNNPNCGCQMETRFIDASFCRKCGHEAEDIVRDRWVESKISDEIDMKGQLDAFGQPISPGATVTTATSSAQGSGTPGPSPFFGIDPSIGLFDYSRVAKDLSLARKGARTELREVSGSLRGKSGGLRSPRPVADGQVVATRTHKHLGTSAEVHPLRDEAWRLRQALGGDVRSHYIQHEKTEPESPGTTRSLRRPRDLGKEDTGSTPFSAKNSSSAFAFSPGFGSEDSTCTSEQPTIASVYDLQSPNSRRMKDSYRQYSAVDLSSPDMTPYKRQYTSPLSMMRPRSAGTNSTSGSDMEIIEVTDSSDDEGEPEKRSPS